MTYAFALIAVVAMVLGVAAIEKKRAAGTLTYPLWQGNLLIPWVALAVLFIVIMGSLNLPRLFALTARGVAAQAVVTAEDARCQTSYRYSVQGREYTGGDSQCGLKPGNAHRIFYDPASPENSTLYPPDIALKNELMAMALIAVCLPTFIVLWLVLTHVIGRKKT